MVSLDEAVVVVTGAARGIGERTAHEFAHRGASVVVADVEVAAGEGTVADITDEGGEATFVEADVTDSDDAAAMVETAVDTYGSLDVAFNNAGIDGELAPVSSYPDDDWESVLDVNLTGVYRCMKAELAQMVEQPDGGVIVNNASVLGKVGFANSSAYVAAKHGVVGLTKTAALENGETGVRVNAVCPGFVDTPLLREGLDEEMVAQVEELHPMKRLGSMDEIANAVAWISSDDASFVTGEAIDVDGGYTAQ